MVSVLLYYRFTPIDDPERLRAEHLQLCESLDIRGRIYIASEGINGTCAGSHDAIDHYERWLRAQPGMEEIAFKRDSAAFVPFRHLRVRVRPSLVNMGPEGDEIDPNVDGGEHLSPAAWRERLDRGDDVLLLDVRNPYEARVGRFRGAQEAPYDSFHEFTAWADALEPHKDKPVMMYCTGGIRCEKFSGLLKRRGFRDVAQLDGGILRYAKEEGGAHFEGEVFVFDDRLTVDIGGAPNTHGRCVWCDKPTSHIRNCANMDCHALHIVCPACHTKSYGCCTEPCQSAERVRALTPSHGQGQSRAVFCARGIEEIRERPSERETHE